MNYLILAILILIGGYDVYLSIKKHPTLSQQYQKLLPTWQDVIVLAFLLAGLCFMPEIHPALRIWMGGILGHIVWPNKERYQK